MTAAQVKLMLAMSNYIKQMMDAGPGEIIYYDKMKPHGDAVDAAAAEVRAEQANLDRILPGGGKVGRDA